MLSRTPAAVLHASPAFYCPQCGRPLDYQQSFIDDRAGTTRHWDRFQCAGGCGEFEYRPPTEPLAPRP